MTLTWTEEALTARLAQVRALAAARCGLREYPAWLVATQEAADRSYGACLEVKDEPDRPR